MVRALQLMMNAYSISIENEPTWKKLIMEWKVHTAREVKERTMKVREMVEKDNPIVRQEVRKRVLSGTEWNYNWIMERLSRNGGWIS